MEIWVLITVAAAFLQNVRSAMQKHLKGRMGTTGATFVRFGFGVPFALLYMGILAVVLASFSGHWGGAWLAIGGGLAYAAFMSSIGSRLLRRLADRTSPDAPLGATLLSVILCIFCLAAWLADALGIPVLYTEGPSC